MSAEVVGTGRIPDRVTLDYGSLYLTEYSVCKTEALTLSTMKLAGVNALLTHLAFAALKAGIAEGAYRFTAENVTFFALFSPEGTARGASVVFYDFKSYPVTSAGDPRLKGLSEFRVERTASPELRLSKLYRVFGSESAHPILDEKQSAIVRMEGKNLLVQGIAGSGKTNLCIDKILFAAASGYGGRTIYSTYSRGLLLDVRRKVEDYLSSLEECIAAYRAGKTSAAASSEALAISRLLGIPFTSDGPVVEKLERVAAYLHNNVDYLLLEDLFRREVGDRPLADEGFFERFLLSLRNYNLTNRLARFSIRREVLYKEIYGFLFGKAVERPVTKEEYVAARKGAFSRLEAEFIFDLSEAYRKEIADRGALELNLACALKGQRSFPDYTLAILDEVQDFTEVQLAFFRSVAVKLFCVGDASQMVNPAYFSFARLKDLLYKKDVTDVEELSYNYRNSPEIAGVVAALSDLNRQTFGVHGFVLSAEAVSSEEGAFAVSFPTGDFAKKIAGERTDNFTVVVASAAEKEALRALLPNKEILTVSEIKGLERDTVVLYNVLSSNYEKFERLAKTEIDRKTADENSLYRYYFNLFYVGVSRARRHLFVAEERRVPLFESFFKENFRALDTAAAVEKLKATVGSTLVDQEEYKRRAMEFTRLGQYDNAYAAARHLINDRERERALLDVAIWRDHVSHGDYVGAGVAYWEGGYPQEAKSYFDLGGEKELSDLVDAASGGSDEKLDYRILRHYDRLMGNPAAMKIILALLKRDSASLKETVKDTARILKGIKK
ncbi:MAG: hypothetical protein J5765_01455 [Clostridia bacterium]|nr:hypothetical protein [Clostridia bacterium]